MKRTIYLILACLFILRVAQAQDSQAPDPAFIEKMAQQEGQAWLKKAQFQENVGYQDYDLHFVRADWTVDPAIRAITGDIQFHIKALSNPLSSMELDLQNNLVIDSIRMQASSFTWTHEDNKIKINFENPIAVNESAIINIAYHGVPSSTGFGSFKTTQTPDGTPILWTLSEPYGAKEWWPCKQSLVDKVDSIEINVVCPESYRVASNGKLISRVAENGKAQTKWKHNYPIATYLVAIAVTDYATDEVYLKQEDDSIQILNYVYPSYLETAKTKTADMLDIMELFNELIGQYPFADEKYGHAQFGWAGGMEHQTMSFMYHLDFELVAHEMAHQWFGDCITLGTWQDIWLNEGFATYLTGLCYENLLDGHYWNNWKRSQINRITTSPIGSVFVKDTTQISTLFSSRLSYSKGAYLLHMLRWELGDEAFFKALKNYFNDPELKYGFARNQDFVTHLEAAADTSLTEFFNDWYYGEGYPSYVLHHYTDYSDNGKQLLTVSQTSSDSSVDFFEMHLPLQVWRNGQSKLLRLHHTVNPQSFILDERPDSIDFDPDLWLITKGSVTMSTNQLTAQMLKLYPNPVVDQLVIEPKPNERIVSVRISNSLGKLIAVPELHQNQLNLSELIPGHYFIQIKTNQNSYQQQFVKASQ